VKLLIVNDDGPDSYNLSFFANFLRSFCHDILIVTPDRDWSGCSALISHNKEMDFYYKGKDHIVLSGSPTDCVYFALKFAEDNGYSFDCIISGINNGLNFGVTNRYSGTIQAALEGMLYGIPSIAVSSIGAIKELEKASYFTFQILSLLQKEIRGMQFVLNINVINSEKELNDEFYYSDKSFRYICPNINMDTLRVRMDTSTKKILLPGALVGAVENGISCQKMDNSFYNKLLEIWSVVNENT
jgi:5'/3'-nucleotidase SurE